jgi:hypothetical protein
MATCPICGDVLTADARVCALCGTNLATGGDTEVVLPRTEAPFEGPKWDLPDEPAASPELPVAMPASPPPALPANEPAAGRGGTILLTEAGGVPPAQPEADAGAAASVSHGVMPPPAPHPAAAGPRYLVLYGADKKPIHSFPVVKDVTLIGRLDPLRGNFPDIDLGEWLEEASARKVSRKHAILLHTRATDGFCLRPLAGNTGTQIEQEMVEALKDHPLVPGTRLILGGVARFKFETKG